MFSCEAMPISGEGGCFPVMLCQYMWKWVFSCEEDMPISGEGECSPVRLCQYLRKGVFSCEAMPISGEGGVFL